MLKEIFAKKWHMLHQCQLFMVNLVKMSKITQLVKIWKNVQFRHATPILWWQFRLGNPPAIHYSSSIFSIYSPLCFYISLSDIQISVYSAFFCNPTFLDIFFCQVYITTKWARSQFCVSNGVKGNLVRHFKCVIVLQHLTLPC